MSGQSGTAPFSAQRHPIVYEEDHAWSVGHGARCSSWYPSSSGRSWGRSSLCRAKGSYVSCPPKWASLKQKLVGPPAMKGALLKQKLIAPQPMERASLKQKSVTPPPYLGGCLTVIDAIVLPGIARREYSPLGIALFKRVHLASS